MPNRLIGETSPYLLQHAHNPVDWYPWGEEALRRAREEDKPIFLSIGYAACHWCHVMERESFEDPEVAGIMNAHFVNVKVDREERPDLDDIYMKAVVALTGHGGWPMSVFLTPEGVPFYGGTYFPPQPRYGMPSFRQVLEAIAAAWRGRREEVLRGGQALLDVLRRGEGPPQADADLRPATLDAAFAQLERQFDLAHGGWGGAPKFPQPAALEFLLRTYVRTGGESARRMAERTLEKMARGGIYDHLGGGFHRYAVDAVWRVPHFEKMLYDNAQLARTYVQAWQATRRPLYRAVAEETLDYLLREMQDPAGGFYSSQDADADGEEGKFYLWTRQEVRAALGDDAPLFEDAYGITAEGNFEGRCVLYRAREPDVLAERWQADAATVEARLAAARRRLVAVRATRVRPGCDDKVLAAWNGLAVGALAEAARVLGRDDYRDAAVRAAAFVLEALRTPRGRLRRSWRRGVARGEAFLEDYANLADGLLTLYETTFEGRWFVEARGLADVMLAHYLDPAGGFFDTADDHETLVVRPKSLQDTATPSGGAAAAGVLLRLAAFTGEGRYRDVAEAALRAVQPLAATYPTAFARWLCALDFALAPPREVAVVGDPARSDTRALLDVLWSAWRPNRVVALARPGEVPVVPLLEGRAPLDGKATAFVCERFTCHHPVTDPAELAALLT